MTTLITRSTTSGIGVTAKNSSLTNSELDNNFISLNDNKLEKNSSISVTTITAAGAVTIGTASVAGSLSMPDAFGNPSLQLVTDQQLSYQTAIVNNWGNSSNPGVLVGTTQANGTAFQVNASVPLSAGGLPNGAGTNLMTVLASGLVGIGTSTPVVSLTVRGTDAVQLPAGTTAQQPAGTSGMIRYNTSTNGFEGYSNNIWSSIGGGGATVSSSPTVGATDGAFWYSTTSGYTAIYISATSSWVNIIRNVGYTMLDLNGGTSSPTQLWDTTIFNAGGTI